MKIRRSRFYLSLFFIKNHCDLISKIKMLSKEKRYMYYVFQCVKKNNKKNETVHVNGFQKLQSGLHLPNNALFISDFIFRSRYVFSVIKFRIGVAINALLGYTLYHNYCHYFVSSIYFFLFK